MKKGKLHIILHSHLPYVLGHGTWPHGTDWLFEAASETYIPLLIEFEKLIEEDIPFKMSISITPILCEQLEHRFFAGGFINYLEQKISSARQNREVFHAIGENELAKLAEMWESEFFKIRVFFEDNLGSSIIGGFKRLQDEGRIEIITCAATHGYLPLLGTDESVIAQIRTGVSSYERFFDKKPDGIWLPECAYRPAYNWKPPVDDWPTFDRIGVEEALFDESILWTTVDSHLLVGGETMGVYIDRYESLKALWARFSEKYSPAPCDSEKTTLIPYIISSPGKSAGCAVLFRDADTGLQVWSGEYGYPGNPAYLEFHKKHFPGGHRYWRVTNAKADLADKEIYHPEWITDTIAEQASHFVSLVENKLENGGVLTAPFDAELFGHWWFEGPRWLSEVARRVAKNNKIGMTTGSEAIRENPPKEVLALPEGSWGQGGFHFIWLNEWTEWTWRKIYKAEYRFKELIKKWAEKGSDAQIEKILIQTARELLLLESSDWQFLISTWSARDYAENRILFHYDAFDKLAGYSEKLLDGQKLTHEERTRFSLLAEQDNPFPDLKLDFWLIK